MSQFAVDEKEKFPRTLNLWNHWNICETPIYSWLYLVWLHMNIWAWKWEKVCSSIHHISVRTVHVRAVVQIYTELSKHLQKNMKSSIHFHLTKSKIHLIFSKTTNTSMPPNCHSDICSSIWFAGPIERWTKQRNEHELPYSLVILKMRDDCGRAESCYPVMQNVNWLTHRKHYNIASTCVSYWTVIKYK